MIGNWGFDPFFSDPFTNFPSTGLLGYGYDPYANLMGTTPSRRRRQQQQQLQGPQTTNVPQAGALTTIPQAEDAGWLSFNNLLSEPLNFQLVEKDNSYELIARPFPGLRKKDLHLEVHNNILTISGERLKHRQRGGTQREEYISFSRSITLPDSVSSDQIKAFYDDQNNLHVEAPKKAEGGPKQIPIAGQKTESGLEKGGQQSEKMDISSRGGNVPIQSEKSEMKSGAEPRASTQRPLS